MKPLSILSLLCVFIFGLLLLISPVDAALIQESTPPPPPSEQNMTGGQYQESPPMDYKADSGTALGTLGEIIHFTDNSKNEWSPAVAHCASDQYLVVYDRDGEIYGQRLSAVGELLGEEISITDNIYYQSPSSHPDVACDFYRDIFVVTWQYDFSNTGTDYDIHARALYGKRLPNGEEFFDIELKVAEDVGAETNPTIACNSDDHNCLVVYEHSGTGAGDIYGRRISIAATEMTPLDEAFNVSLAFDGNSYLVNEREPDIVWSGYRDEYMLVWSYDFGDRYQIVHAAVHDTQKAGPQYKPGVYPLFGNQGGQSNPVVAYSCRSDEYLVAFENLYYGTKLVYIKGIGGGSAFRHREQMDIPMVLPAIAYSNGPQDIPSGMGADQFLVTYVLKGLSNTELIGQAVKGDYVEGNPQKDGIPLSLFTTLTGQNFGIGTSNITGSVNSGKYFVVWDNYSGGYAGFNFDILGRMVSPQRPFFQLSVTKGGSGSGVVTSNPAGINCGGNCSATYEEGTAVTLTATADAGSTFAGWSGACSGTNTTCVVTMTQPKSVTATFNTTTPTTFLLTVTKEGSGNGVVTSSPAGINCGGTCTASYANGTAVTLTAAPGANTIFNGWGGACSGFNPTCVLTINQAKSVVADFQYSATPNTKHYLPLLFR